MKRTLLEMTQAILNDMDADEVAAISDTFEAEQVAVIIRDAYFALIDSRNWPHLRKFVTMEETSATTPTHITLPDVVKEMIHISYDVVKSGDTRKQYKPLKYKYPDEFLAMTNQRNNDNSNIDVITDPSGADLLIRNDVKPQYWTSFDDQTLVLDSYDSGVDTYVKAAKFQSYCYTTPVWSHLDSATPDLPEEAFTLLVEEAKSTAFLTLKQMANEKAEQRSQKADAWLSRKAFVTAGGVRYANFGRKPNQTYKPQPLDKDN